MSDNSTKIEWNNFSESSSDRDLGLQVENSIFWVSRRGLADCSSVFNTMLYGEFKESKQKIIKLSDKEPDAILELLRCIFPCKDQSEEKKLIDGENVELLLSLGDEYQITDLLDGCWEFIKGRLIRNPATVEENAKFLQLAILYKKKGVIRLGLRELSKFETDQGLFTDQAFLDLPISIRYAVLMIGSLYASLPIDHDLKPMKEERGYYFVERPISECVMCKRTVYGCDWCQDKEEAEYKCRVCHQCKMRYETTDFICKCIDPIIEAELVKLGLI